MAELIEVTDLPTVYQSRDDIDRLIAAVSKLAESYCRRPLTLQPGRVEYHDGGPWYELFLKVTPIVSIDSIFANGFEITDFIYDASTGRVRRGSGHGSPNYSSWFPEGAGNIVVTYTGGYLVVPDDLKEAIVQGVVGMIREKDRDSSLQSESFAGQYSWTRATNMAGASARYAVFGSSGLALLTPYRRPGQYVIG